MDKDLPAMRTLTMQQVVDEQSNSRRIMTALFGTFAALAVLLASVGIYGVFSQMVAQRSREIGLRMALGAQRSAILRLVLGQAMARAAMLLLVTAAASGLPAFRATRIDPMSALRNE
jgi:putative ABC transport system permease protein